MIKKLLVLCFLVFSFQARAQTFTSVPYVFTANTLFNTSQIMANFAALVNQGNAVAAALNNAVSNISPFPQSALVYFNENVCPSGWNLVSTVNGYFFRTYDTTGVIDPTLPAFNSGEPATIQAHAHGFGPIFTSVTSYSGVNTGAGASHAFYNFPINQAFAAWYTATTSGAGSVIAPKNVQLLLCSKN
jgi:hypothetical protein